MTGLFIALVIFIIIIFYGIAQYNNLVEGRNQNKNAFSQIDIQLKRRYDLIPNLIETAKKYMAHESETLEKVIHARNQAQNIHQKLDRNPTDPAHMSQLLNAETQLSQSLGKIFALAESYPDLKANHTMSQLMEELTSTENKISFARQGYNDSVLFYNNRREVFPSNIIAQFFNFKEAPLWEIQNVEERENIKVKF